MRVFDIESLAPYGNNFGSGCGVASAATSDTVTSTASVGDELANGRGDGPRAGPEPACPVPGSAATASTPQAVSVMRTRISGMKAGRAGFLGSTALRWASRKEQWNSIMDLHWQDQRYLTTDYSTPQSLRQGFSESLNSFLTRYPSLPLAPPHPTGRLRTLRRRALYRGRAIWPLGGRTSPEPRPESSSPQSRASRRWWRHRCGGPSATRV